MSRDNGSLRLRLVRALNALERAGQLTAEQARAAMDSRAAALAGAVKPRGEARVMIEVLIFDVAGERYGIETCYVRAIARLLSYSPLPQAPPHFFGLSAVRGELVAIVDLRRLLHIGQPGLNDLSRMIVLGTDYAEFAVLADVVHEVTSIASDELRPPPDFVSGAGKEYMLGVTTAPLIVLSGKALLDDKKLHLNQGADV